MSSVRTNLDDVLRQQNLSRYTNVSNADAKIASVIKKLGANPDDVEAGLGSKKTILLIYPKFVVKIYPDSANIRKEVEILSDINSKHVVKVLGYRENPNVIVYSKVSPMINLTNPTRAKLLLLMCDISAALYHIHSKGYTHGDVAMGNIGTKGEHHVLYDFEDAKENTTDELRFKDVEMFLEDLIIQLKHHSDLKGLVVEELESLRQAHTRKTTKEIMFLGRPKRRSITEYRYNPEDFTRAIIRYCRSMY
jgi:tRNA A-37 threonylcarbamoyl transferase component Bud32